MYVESPVSTVYMRVYGDIRCSMKMKVEQTLRDICHVRLPEPLLDSEGAVVLTIKAGNYYSPGIFVRDSREDIGSDLSRGVG